MKTNKDIGAALKHRLDHFKNSPDDLVWNKIETQLQKKKRKKTLILWLSGLSISTILLVFWLSNPFQNTIDSGIQKTNPNISDHNTKPSTEKDSFSSRYNTPIILKIEKDNVNYKNKSITNKKSGLNSKINFNSTPSIKKSSLNNKKPNEIATIIMNESIKKDGLFKSNIPKKQQDSLSVVDEELKLTSEEEEEEESVSRWSITPQSTLAYYSNNFTLNYGVIFSYRVNEKIFLRIGARKLNLKQTIDNFQINIEYLELPLKVKYAPFDKKINPYFTGGLSYFILQKATINNQDYMTPISLNAGIGAEHKLYKDLLFTIDSNLNYQIKIVSKNNISPFIFSINVGIEYRF